MHLAPGLLTTDELCATAGVSRVTFVVLPEIPSSFNRIKWAQNTSAPNAAITLADGGAS